MEEQAYNLTEEKWIRALSRNGQETKLDLREVFLEAQNYLDIGGEIRLQDMAVLRLLIAISVTLLYRYDENGERADLADYEQALDRFAAVFKNGKYSQKAVNAYFDEWYDRFELFDDTRPFFQITLTGLGWEKDGKNHDDKLPCLGNGVTMNWMPMTAINGRIQSSNNRPATPYKDISGESAELADIDEAVRWMMFYNAYGDCTVGKKKNYIDEAGNKQSANAGMTLPSNGSLVTPVGKNLFETIMLSSVLFDPDRNELYKTMHPVWEEDCHEREIARGKPVPNDLARMYTQQARRMSLVRVGDKIKGAYVSAGESYSGDQLWMEPAFMMKPLENGEAKESKLVPVKCKNGVDVWREMEHIAGDKGAAVTRWINTLYSEDILPDDEKTPFRVTGISYVSNGCGIQTMLEDSIVLSRKFMEDSETRQDAVAEIKRVEKIAKVIEEFGANCARCMGLPNRSEKGSPVEAIRKELADQYYSCVGIDIRRFLAGDMPLNELRKREFAVAKKVTDEFIERNIKTLLRGKPGDNGMSLGKCQLNFQKRLSALEREIYGKR